MRSHLRAGELERPRPLPPRVTRMAGAVTNSAIGARLLLNGKLHLDAGRQRMHEQQKICFLASYADHVSDGLSGCHAQALRGSNGIRRQIRIQAPRQKLGQN